MSIFTLLCTDTEPLLIWQSTWLHGCGAHPSRLRAKEKNYAQNIPKIKNIYICIFDVFCIMKVARCSDVFITSTPHSWLWQTFTTAWHFLTYTPTPLQQPRFGQFGYHFSAQCKPSCSTFFLFSEIWLGNIGPSFLIIAALVNKSHLVPWNLERKQTRGGEGVPKMCQMCFLCGKSIAWVWAVCNIWARDTAGRVLTIVIE